MQARFKKQREREHNHRAAEQLKVMQAKPERQLHQHKQRTKNSIPGSREARVTAGVQLQSNRATDARLTIG